MKSMKGNLSGPKRSLGQNFLLDKNLADFVVRQLGIAGGEVVIEVGPGTGALTGPALLHPVHQLVAIEKDRQLAAALSKRFPAANLEVVCQDALEFDLRGLWRGHPVVLLGNLPYNVSTALLAKFTAELSPVRRAVVTVQREVADRMSAAPGGGDYGAYSVLLQRRWRARQVRILPPQVFRPRPRVESAVVVLERRPDAEILRADGNFFEQVVRTGFRQRRKQLRKLLGVDERHWQELAVDIGFEPDTRAERLSPVQWQQLAARLDNQSADHGADSEMFDVVDAEDRVVGVLPRKEVHRQWARHRAVHMLICNGRGELFLQRRAPWKEINPGVWDSSAAGHLEAGEDYPRAAVRELQEELGVRASLTRLGKLEPSEATGNEFIEVYVGRHDGPFRLAGLEITAGAFFPLDQILAWSKNQPADFSPVFRECLREFQAGLQRFAAASGGLPPAPAS